MYLLVNMQKCLIITTCFFLYMCCHKLAMLRLVLAMIILIVSDSNPKATQKPVLVS